MAGFLVVPDIFQFLSRAEQTRRVPVFVTLLFTLLLCIPLLLMSGQSQATQVIRNLYDVGVPVADQSPNSRQAGFQSGLNKLLRRLTGRDDLPSGSDLASDGGQVSSLVSQFKYQELSELERETTGLRYELKIKFNEESIYTLLKNNDLPLWGAGRPSVLVWIAQEARGRREFVSSQTPSAVRDGITRSGQNWGIPVIYPLMDFDDASALSISELWGLFSQPILRASVRYGVNAVAGVRVWPSQQGSNLWNGRTVFLFQGQQHMLDFTDVPTAEISERVVADIARHMSAFYGVTPDSAPDRPIRLQVSGIRDARAYAGVLKYLEGMTAVRHVTPVQVNQSEMLLDVQIDGSVEQLNAAIGLGRKLTRAGVGDESGWFPDLHYYWQN